MHLDVAKHPNRSDINGERSAIKGNRVKIGDEVTIFWRFLPWGWCKVIDKEYIKRKQKYILTIEELTDLIMEGLEQLGERRLLKPKDK